MKNFIKVFTLSSKQMVSFRCEFDHGLLDYRIECSTYVRATFYRYCQVYDSYDEMKYDFEFRMNQDNAENFYRFAFGEVDSLEDEQMGLGDIMN
jgi:hypothetical protein